MVCTTFFWSVEDLCVWRCAYFWVLLHYFLTDTPMIYFSWNCIKTTLSLLLVGILMETGLWTQSSGNYFNLKRREQESCKPYWTVNGSDLESCSVDLSTCRIQVLGIDFIELVKSVLAKYKSSFFSLTRTRPIFPQDRPRSKFNKSFTILALLQLCG